MADRPGSHWNYSSGTANLVAGIVRRAMEKQTRPYYVFLYRELFHRIGMDSAVLEPDPSGTFVGSSYLWATARDWARFGLLYLRDGVWDSNEFIADMRRLRHPGHDAKGSGKFSVSRRKTCRLIRSDLLGDA